MIYGFQARKSKKKKKKRKKEIWVTKQNIKELWPFK